MALLFIGLILFFGTHLSPGVFGLRPLFIAKLGEKTFRGFYVALSVTGMLAIIGGKSTATFNGIYHPPIWGNPVVPILMALACILLMALFLPTNIKRLTHHPMLWGIACWSAANLLANGDLASILVFGGFGLYAMISIVSLNRRGTPTVAPPCSPLKDGLLVIAGLALYAIIIWAHPYLFGVSPFL